jgi:hypothetical protein
MTMDNFELRLAGAPLRRPSPGLDDRVRAAKPEGPSSPQSGRATWLSMLDRMPLALKLAAALLVAVVLVGTGWAAERIYRTLTETHVELENIAGFWKVPDGHTFTTVESIGTEVNSDDPGAPQAARREHAEMKRLIAEKKYKLLRTYEDRYGEKHYVYAFTLADGSTHNMGFSVPLDNVGSWDDYLRKKAEQDQRWHDRINKAIAAGRFRLIDLDEIRVQICRDVASDLKLEVQRIDRDDGKDRALLRPIPAKKTWPTTPESYQTTSWQDHLQAIRDEKRELLGLRTTKTYTYEVVLEDGSKTIFRYGGGGPLKKPDGTESRNTDSH